MAGMDVKEVMLPGVGLRYELTTQAGDLVGIVTRRTGDVEIVTYEPGDPDQSTVMVRLTRREAVAVAEILGAPRVAARFAELTKEVPGLTTGQVEVDPDSPFVGRPLGETRARTRTGASIVAVVRATEVVVSPRPTERLQVGDLLVVVGTAEGIVGIRTIVSG